MIEVRPAGPADAAAVQWVDAAATATLRETYRPNPAALARKARLSARLKRLGVALGHPLEVLRRTGQILSLPIRGDSP